LQEYDNAYGSRPITNQPYQIDVRREEMTAWRGEQTFIRGLTHQDLKRGQDVDDSGYLATRNNFRFGGLELSEKALSSNKNIENRTSSKTTRTA